LNNYIITIIGRKGCGKTTLAKELLTLTEKPIVIIDTIKEYTIGLDIYITNLHKYFRRHRFIIRLTPENEPELNRILNFVYTKGNCQVLIDEAGYWQTPYYCPAGIDRILRYGRHKGIDIIQVVRRPAELNRLSTAMTDVFYVFKTTEPKDLEYLGRIDSRLPELVKNLDRYEYIRLDFMNDYLEKGKTLDNLKTYTVSSG